MSAGDAIGATDAIGAADAIGAVTATLAGRPVRLRLTLGALAEIETGLGLAAGEDLGARLSALRACDLLLVLRALIRGGEADVGLVDPADASAEEAAAAVLAAFRAGRGGGLEGKPTPPVLG